MNADSIAGTVTAVLCVVVGLMIIGTALVPIVENASETETTTTETATGENTLNEALSENIGYGVVRNDLAASGSDPNITIDGHTFDKATILMDDGTTLTITDTNDILMTPGEIELMTFTLSAENGSYTISATTDDNEPYETSGSYSFITIFVDLEDTRFVASDDEILAPVTPPVTIGHDQELLFIDIEDMSCTMVSADSVLPDDMTRTENDDGSYTFSYSEPSIICAPLEWTQETTVTVTETSEYAPLYAILPIMLILSMAYVLIRRF